MSHNHAYTIAFSVPGCEDANSETTLRRERDRVLAFLLQRIASLAHADDFGFAEMIGPAFDSFEEDDEPLTLLP
jgi:hypothetical protein